MSSIKRSRDDQSTHQSSDMSSKRDKHNSMCMSANDTVRIQPIAEAVFTAHVLPYLALDDLFNLICSLVCCDWCNWSTSGLISNATNRPLVINDENDDNVCYARRITEGDEDWDENLAYESENKLVYAEADPYEGTPLVISLDCGEVSCKVRWCDSNFSDQSKRGYIRVNAYVIDSRECYDIDFIEIDEDFLLAFTVEGRGLEADVSADDDDSEEEDEKSDWETVSVIFHSLRITTLYMTAMWCKTLDRMRWIRLVVLTSEEHRRDWRLMTLFYQQHNRKFKRISCHELKDLAKICLAGGTRRWMAHSESVMSRCTNIPMSFWNIGIRGIQPKDAWQRSVEPKDAWQRFVELSLIDTEDFDVVSETISWLHSAQAAQQVQIVEEERIRRQQELDRLWANMARHQRDARSGCSPQGRT